MFVLFPRESIYTPVTKIWDKYSENGPSKTCGRQPLKNLKGYGLLKIFKGCLPQMLLGPFVNTLPHKNVYISNKVAQNDDIKILHQFKW